MLECERIIGSIEHFYGHLEIESVGHLGLTSIEYKADVESRKQEIRIVLLNQKLYFDFERKKKWNFGMHMTVTLRR